MSPKNYTVRRSSVPGSPTPWDWRCRTERVVGATAVRCTKWGSARTSEEAAAAATAHLESHRA